MNLLQIIKEEGIDTYYIDLFAGAGGTSTGVEKAEINGKKVARVIACVNHDINAIASHFANHPHSLHFTEDIRTLNLSLIVSLVKKIRVMKPDAKIVLWASLECTNFSKAKGGLPRDADSRTLAEHLFRYIEHINPDYIQIENVEEFMAWGDVDEKGRPISMKKGCSYQRWISNVMSYGYDYDYRILNAADYGAYTSRRRYFGIFAKGGCPIAFPEATHAKNPPKGDMFGTKLKKWKAVKEVLDFTDEGESIFDRRKPLVEATLKRIYAGLIKFVAGGKDSFLSAYYGNGDNVSDTDAPAPTVTTKDRLAFIDMQYGNGYPTGIYEPAGTVTTNPKHQMVTCKPWVMNTNFNNVGSSIDEPAQVVTANRKWPYMVTPISGTPIHISELDSEIMVKIKVFMVMYGIIDIKMRMLRISELKQIMGFPKDYKLIGTKAEQKKYIGNAVEVNMAMYMCMAIAIKSNEQVKKVV
ncbi:MAG: DNA cytosine methyltransferase [Fermentimonas sp.]|nr:DNA cytosine methyltransferase [Fermentimonas sp.]